ncbi:hypothetical protein V6N13_089772 [Hibiscus sabdariffa]
MEEAHSMGIGQSDIWTLFLRRRKSHIAFLLAFHFLLTVIPGLLEQEKWLNGGNPYLGRKRHVSFLLVFCFVLLPKLVVVLFRP